MPSSAIKTMKAFLQILLGLLFLAVGFLGGWMAYLWWQNMNYWWAGLLALILLVSAVWLNVRRSDSRWLSAISIGYGSGASLIVLAISYGRAGETFGFAILTALVAGVTVFISRGNCPKTILRCWLGAFVIGLVSLFTDHLCLNGQLYAWKWRVIEQPFFGPGAFIKVERHGRRAIYATDTGFVDPCAEAIVWGWHVFPRVVYFGDDIPDGELLKDPKIQEVIR